MTQSGIYEFLAQDRVIFGRPARDAIVETADKLGKRQLLIVASKTLSRRTDVIAGIKEALGDPCAGVFDECVEHVPRSSVLRLAATIKRLQPELIVTVGGGTPMDTVKVMLVCLAENITSTETLGDYYIRAKPDGTREVKPVGSPAPPSADTETDDA